MHLITNKVFPSSDQWIINKLQFEIVIIITQLQRVNIDCVKQCHSYSMNNKQ